MCLASEFQLDREVPKEPEKGHFPELANPVWQSRSDCPDHHLNFSILIQTQTTKLYEIFPRAGFHFGITECGNQGRNFSILGTVQRRGAQEVKKQQMEKYLMKTFV